MGMEGTGGGRRDGGVGGSVGLRSRRVLLQKPELLFSYL
jgi:hypothetical protein